MGPSGGAAQRVIRIAVPVLLCSIGLASSTWAQDPPDPCDPVDLLVGEQATGSLAIDDCSLLDLGVAESSTAWVDPYRIVLDADAALSIGLESPDFDAYVGVFDEDLTTLIRADDDSGEDSNALISHLALGPGTFVILANSFSAGEVGTYTLTTSVDVRNDACDEVLALQLDETVQGTLMSGDCTIAELGLDSEDHSYVHQYGFDLRRGGEVTIRLESGQFDAFLILLDGSLSEVIGADDDGGGGTDAEISALDLEAGTYTILANSYGPGETGDYALTLVPEPAPALLGAASSLTLMALRRARRRGAHAIAP